MLAGAGIRTGEAEADGSVIVSLVPASCAKAFLTTTEDQV
jgi:hypothetical protein